MSNAEENFDDHGHDSASDGDEKKAYESILTHPSYFSATMKVNIAFQFFCVLKRLIPLHLIILINTCSACF